MCQKGWPGEPERWNGYTPAFSVFQTDETEPLPTLKKKCESTKTFFKNPNTLSFLN